MKTLIRLGGFFKPYKFILLISIIASVLYGLFNAASLWIVGTLIANLFGSSTFDNYDIDSLIGKINYFFSNLISAGSQIEQLKMICIFLFITFLFKNIFYYINWVSVSYIQLNIIKNLRNKFYSKIQQFSLQFFDKNKTGEILSFAKAKLEVDGEKIMCEGEGNGPVNALDNAIRQNVDRLAKYSKYLKDLKLVDYKVRILNTGTEAVTRVSIESTDSQGKNWFTIGVSTNIIEASFKALIDSLDYKLFKDNAPASK